MDLLNQIIRQPVDPDYAVVSRRGEQPHRRWPLAVVAVVIGAMFAVAALQTTRSAPATAVERTQLIARIEAVEARQDTLRARSVALTGEVATLRTAALGTDDRARSLEGRIDTLGPVTGDVAVRGPGLVVTVDDAVERVGRGTSRSGGTGTGPDQRDRVLDLDLQILVNGLWRAGAEAVAVNGHRLSTLTAIRGAGDAITVDYRSLDRPYVVEAVGDPRTLPARFAETTGAAWWHDLAQNRRMRYDVATTKQTTLPADPGLVLRHARRARS